MPRYNGRSNGSAASPLFPYWQVASQICPDLIFGKDSPSAESEEKHEPVSDIDTGVVDSLKSA